MFWGTQMYDNTIIIIKWLNEILPVESSMRYQASQVSCEKLPVHHTEGIKKKFLNSSA